MDKCNNKEIKRNAREAWDEVLPTISYAGKNMAEWNAIIDNETPCLFWDDGEPPVEGILNIVHTGSDEIYIFDNGSASFEFCKEADKQ